MAYDISYVRDFTGGENTVSAPDQLLDSQVLAAENVDILLRGGFQKRLGSAVDGQSFVTDPVRIIPFSYLSGTDRVNKMLYLCADGNMYLGTAPTVVAYAWGNGYHVDYEVVNNKCYLIGGGKFVVWDGSTFAAVTNSETDSNLTTIAKCNLLEQRGQRLFASGNPEAPNKLYFSEVGDPTYWKTVSAINAISDDDDTITAIKEFFDALVVFKKRSIYAWSGWDPTADVEFNRLAVASGTRAYRTVHYVGDKLLYLGDDGLYALKGTYKNVIVSERLSNYHTPEFRNIYRPVDVVFTGVTTKVYDWYNPTHAIVYEGKYLLSTVQGASWLWPSNASPPADPLDPRYPYVSNTDIFVLSLDALDAGTVQITTYKGWEIAAFAVHPFTGYLLGARCIDRASYNPRSLRLFTGYDDEGSAYTMRLKTAPQAQGEPVKRKKYRYGYVWMRQYESGTSSMDVIAYVDYAEVTNPVEADESGVWDESVADWDVSKWDFIDLVTRRISVKKRGKRVVFEFVDSNKDQPLLVYGLGIEYRTKKPEKT